MKPALRWLLATWRRQFFGVVLTYIVLQMIFHGLTLSVVTTPLRAFATAGSFAALLLALWWLKVRRVRAVPSAERASYDWKAVIVLVSQQTFADSSSSFLITRTRAPELVGLVATDDVTDEASETRRELEDGFGLEVKIENVNPHRLDDVRRGVADLVTWMTDDRDLLAKDVVIDVTGSTKLVSLGAVKVAEQHDLDCVYVASLFRDGQRVPGTEHGVMIRDRGVR